MQLVCTRCGRPVRRPHEHDLAGGGPAARTGGERLPFSHGYLGCDTGLCGHRFYVVDERGHVMWSHLALGKHDQETVACQAAEMVRRFGVVVDWAASERLRHAEAERRWRTRRRAG